MDYTLKERIGSPELFTGRKAELDYLLKWIDGIKQEKSQSTAILARRKMGKSALMERLFNITFAQNNGVIPFYFEINEEPIWIVDFCQSFFSTFIYQYIAYKTRKQEYLKPERKTDLAMLVEIAKKEGLPYICGIIEDVARLIDSERIGLLWETVRETPQTIAFRQKEVIVQMIDEFQFFTTMIYYDKEMKSLADKMVGGYLSTAESKIAPLLVSGSWVGWLMNMLTMLLPARFKYRYLPNMPQNEAVEMIYKYSLFFDVPVTDETAYLLATLAEGSPFYISCMMRSSYEKKDLTTIDGLTRTLEFETLNDQGTIKTTWMEYVLTAFSRVNGRNAKRIVLHLFKHKGKELTRKELLDQLELNMTDDELEKKLTALIRADIITQGQTNFDYRCIEDNIFDKVFRGVYQKEIEHFEISDIRKEYTKAFDKLKRQYRRLLGRYNYQKGIFLEYVIIDQLRLHGQKKNEFLKSITRNLPEDFNFCRYRRVWRYDSSPVFAECFNVDLFARAENECDYSIIGEIKNRNVQKFSKEEIMDFERKLAGVAGQENLERVIGFIFCSCGFTEDAETYCREKGIAVSDNIQWFEN